MKNLDFSHLNGKVCIITGGAGIIGRSICEVLAKVGIKTAILDQNVAAACDLASELTRKFGTFFMGIEADVLSRESLVKAHDRVTAELGSVDFLINGAGGNSPDATTRVEQIINDGDLLYKDTFFGLDIQSFDKVFALNFSGTILPTMIFAKDMVQRGEGVVLNISSMNSFRPLTKIPAYSAAKASINNFTQWLAVHLAKTGVRVNAVAPGFFLTNQNRFLMVDEKTGKPTARGKKIISNTPVGRYGQPDDLQGAVLFLLSGMSSFITGVVLPVDGGYSAFGGV
jgi:NAD(P)-dependent dehydrogenase (short-subunit alcohol dehydrogenase family)